MNNRMIRMISLKLEILTSREGINKAEIGRILGVHRATAGRYILELSNDFPLEQKGSKYLFAGNRNYLFLKLDLPENINYTFIIKRKAASGFSQTAHSVGESMILMKRLVLPCLEGPLAPAKKGESRLNVDPFQNIHTFLEKWVSDDSVRLFQGDGKDEIMIQPLGIGFCLPGFSRVPFCCIGLVDGVPEQFVSYDLNNMSKIM